MNRDAREPGQAGAGFWARGLLAPTMLAAQMPKPVPDDPSQAALRSLIWRVVVFFVAGLVVIAAFVIAWRVGAFSPSRP
jgi:L-asparagine transporter-like permease